MDNKVITLRYSSNDMNAKFGTKKNIQMLYTGRMLFVLLFVMLSIPLMAADGDTFWAKTVEGVEMNFKVISEADKTCQVGDGLNASVNDLSKGVITIPNSVNGYVVTSIGECAFLLCLGLTRVTIPNSVMAIGSGAFKGCWGLTSITIPSTVTSIGYEAFWRCSSLTSVTIPNSVTNIQNYAFFGCSGLTSVTIPNSLTTIGVETFSGCSGLTSITIPNSVTSIHDYAFSDCSGLTSITIPTSVMTIGSGAFSGCSGLTSIVVLENNLVYDSRDNCNAIIETSTQELLFGCKNTVIPNSVTSIGSYAFSGCSGLTSVTIPNSVTSIHDYAFSGCSGLTSITIPNSVRDIGSYAFSECSSLTSVTIPSSVTNIGDDAFSGCSGLTSVTIPNSITNIGYRAFSGCSGLTSVTIPNSVTSIHDYAFSGCSGLTSITIPNSVKDIGSYAFSECSSLTNITIPKFVMSIKCCMFKGCSGLTSVTIPNSVTNIEDAAFQYCWSLTSVNIPNSVTSIGNSAFSDCSSLTSITIPNSVTRIDSYAFYYSGLKSVISDIRVPFEISDDVFAQRHYGNTIYPTLYVPYGTDLLYKSTQGWNKMTIMVQQGNTLGEGDTFVVSTIEGVKITYTIKNIIKKQCSVTNLGNSAIENQTAKHVTIPETANGFTVTGIDNEALAGCKSLISISFPSTITTPGKQIFKDCNNLAAIQWYADATLPMSAMEGVSNPNLLLYVKNESYAPKGNWIVVKNGVADDIVLHETASGNNFYCPKEFTARSVKYTHNYSMSSGYKTCQGWETIALPFDVANISYQESVELVPYKTWEPGSQQRPFWLYEQTAEGWKPATAIKGNTPYIVCMPNNKDKYEASYNIEGDITFQATGCKVYASDSIKPMKYAERSFVAAFQEQAVGSNIYALNVNNAWDSYTYSTYLPGSTFIIGLRPVHPFEAYMTTDSANAPQYIPVFDEEEVITGIPVLANDKVLKGEAVIYDLSGRRITNSTDKNLLKGVYIVNGRKVVVK